MLLRSKLLVNKFPYVDGSNLGRRCLGDYDLGASGTANVHAGLPCLSSLSLEEIHLALGAKEQMARAKFIALVGHRLILALLAIQWCFKRFGPCVGNVNPMGC